MIIDPRDPFGPIIGHSPTSCSDRWAIVIVLLMIAAIGGGLVATIAYGVANLTRSWGWW